MSKRPWMPLYIADYHETTRGLSAAEHGAYLLLLMEYWVNEKLPHEDNRLARIAAMTLEEWAAAKPTIQSFFTADWRHKRLDEELRRVIDVSNKRRQAGAKGGHIASVKASAPAQDQANVDANAHANSKQKEEQEGCNSQHTSHYTSHTSPTTPRTSEREASAAPTNALRSMAKRAGVYPPTKRATRLPEDWKLSHKNTDHAREEGLSEVQMEREAKAFRNFWHAKAGKDAAKMNWDATWHNWVMRFAKDNNLKPRAPPNAAPKEQQLSVDDWKLILQNYATTSNWKSVYGPAPGEPGCRVPKSLLPDTIPT